MTDAHVQKVLDHIDTDELVKIALDLGNIAIPMPQRDACCACEADRRPRASR